MDPNTQIVTDNADVSAAAIDELLEGLDMDMTDVGEASEPVTEIIETAAEPTAGETLEGDSLIDQAEADAALATMKEEVYKEQADGSSVTLEGEAAAATTAATTPAAAPAPRAPKAPKIERDLSALPAEAFVLSIEDATAPGFDAEANKVKVLGAKPTQKKIAEKFENLFTALAAGRTPSVYVMDCFKALDARKTMTQAELSQALQKGVTNVYSAGTANSQAGQIGVLFPLVGIVKKDGKNLVLNEDSTIVLALRKLLAPTA